MFKQQQFWLVFSIASLCLCFSPGSGCRAEDWPQFRGNSAAGTGGDSIPAAWSDAQNLAWRTELPGRGSSSPVTFGDRIFISAYSGYAENAQNPGQREDLRLHVICLSLSEGKVLWDYELDAAVEEQEVDNRVGEHGYASPTPCLDASNVYAAFGPSGVVALTHDGEFLWQRSVGTKTAGFGAAASPIVVDDLVIMNASIEDDAIYGIDKATGVVRWRTSNIMKAWTTPTVVRLDNGEKELVVNQKNSILGLNPTNGEKLWWCDAIEDYIVPSVVVDGETLYCSGGRSNRTFALKAGGRGEVTKTHVLWQVSRGANVTTPLLIGNHLYWSHDKAIALCIRASDGEVVFQERLPTRSRVYASIVSDGEKLFLTTRDSGVLVLAAQPEYRELAINKLGGPDESFNATPALVGDRLLLRSNRALYCVRETR